MLGAILNIETTDNGQILHALIKMILSWSKYYRKTNLIYTIHNLVILQYIIYFLQTLSKYQHHDPFVPIIHLGMNN